MLPAVPTTTPRKRLSLTKTDVHTTAGLELLQVLQSITDDGHLQEAEVLQLREWLTTNVAVALPSREYLTDVINDVLSDGVITEDEYKVLHDAVLRVLPPELRSIADLRRREKRKEDREAKKQSQEEEKQRQRDERDRNRPLQRADFMIAGATIGEERRMACESCCDDDPVMLVREPDNDYDKNAIQVVDAGGDVLGYVPRDLAADLAPLMDNGAKQDFRVKKLLETSSERIIPVIVGALYRGDVDISSHVPSSEAQAKLAPPQMQLPPSAGIAGGAAAATPKEPPALIGKRAAQRPVVTNASAPIVYPKKVWTKLDIAIWVGAGLSIAFLIGVLLQTMD